MHWKHYLAAGLVGLIGSGVLPAQVVRTWTGSTSSDWFNASNWSPVGVPAGTDTVNVTNGTVNLTAAVTISGRFNWAGGTLQGNALTIGNGGLLTIVAAGGQATLQTSLTNAGTVTWQSGDLVLPNCNGSPGPIVNLTGALWDIQCDRSVRPNCTAGLSPFFQNLGNLRKSAGTNTSSFSLAVFNSGTLTVETGTVQLHNGGVIDGTYSTTNGTALLLDGGSFSAGSAPQVGGSGSSQLSGGSVFLPSNTIANLPLVGGTVTLGTNFQGGAITNLDLPGAVLSGNYTISGTLSCANGFSGNLQVASGGKLDWLGGTGTGALNIAGNGELKLDAGNGLVNLSGTLTNAGTVTWIGGDLVLPNCNASPGPVVNLPGALWEIVCDRALRPNCTSVGVNGFFQNLGTVRKSASTGTTLCSLPLLNSGQVIVLEGNFNLNNGGLLDGSFEAMLGRNILLTGGNFSTGENLFIARPGSVQLTGGNLTLDIDLVAALPLLGGSVTLGTNFQGGSITNLTLASTVLQGNHLVTGRLNCGAGFTGNLSIAPGAEVNWSGGTASGSLNISSNGLLNLVAGGGTVTLAGNLTNAGTVSWLSGDLVLPNCNANPGPVVNLSGALWDVQCDRALRPNCTSVGANGFFQNLGTVRKSASTGTTPWSLPLLNSGTVQVLAGVLDIEGGGVIDGSYSATNGAELHFKGGGFTAGSKPVISGVSQFTGGSLLLVSDPIPNLPLVGGTVTLSTNFQGGNITNLTLLGSLLNGNYSISGTFNCGNGFSGNLTMADGGTMNWSGGTAGGSLSIASGGLLNLVAGGATLTLAGNITNAGTVSWLSGDLVLPNCNANPGPVVNLPGALWDVQCDRAMRPNCSSAGVNGFFENLGTLRKSGGTGTSTFSLPLYNAGTLTLLEGILAANGGMSLTGGILSFGLDSVDVYGRLAISGSAALAGSLKVEWLGGFVPALSNSFALVNYGSSSGLFTNVDLPAAAIWQTIYGANAFRITVNSVSKLAFLAPPAGTTAGSILAPVVVQVEDVNGNALPTNGVPITLSLASGSGPLGGTLTRSTDGTGKALFDDLNFTLSGSKTLQVAAPGNGLSSTISAPFSIAAKSPSRLVLVGPVASPQAASTVFSPPPMVEVVDQFGNVVSNSVAPITLAATSNGGGRLSGVTAANASGTNGTATFNGVQFNLAAPGRAETVTLYFNSPGLSPVTNNTMLVGFPLSFITLRDQNSEVQIDPTTERGLFSWAVDGIEQAYQHWFWLGIGSNAPQSSVDHLGTAWGLAYNSTNARLSFLAQGLDLQLGFTLHGATPGSFVSSLAENLSIQNLSNAPVVLHFFEYSDFDLADRASSDAISMPAAGSFTQRGKGMVLNETVVSPTPLHWEARFYDFTPGELDSTMPLTLADAIIPGSLGDQTFAFQWDLTLAPGQSVSFALNETLGPAQVALTIVSQETNVVVSWSTNSLAGLQLRAGAISEPAASWQVLTNMPEILGGEYQVKMPPSFGARSFRLQR